MSTEKSPINPLRLRIFNPHRLNDEELERLFVARQHTFDSLISDVLGAPRSAPPQNHLIVGQRGMGKTTLLRRVAVELRKPENNDKFVPLTFPEEQYVEVDRLSKFWLNCLDAVADALEAEGQNERVAELDEEIQKLDRQSLDENERAREALAILTKLADGTGRRPVLLLDNFNLLLRKLKDKDHALREFFTRSGAPIIVAAATVQPDQLSDYGAAFFDSFKPWILHRLSADEMHKVIAEIARQAERTDVIDRLQTQRSRLAALKDLTGGNPRTTILLFEHFANGLGADAYEDLDYLLDRITPLYQSRLDQLPDQGQTIVSTLCKSWSPMTAETLARTGGLIRSSVSPQLGRLEEIGLVEKTRIFPGKKSGYQIAERFFNIWYLMRFATRRRRTSLVYLARFLEGFYSAEELRKCAASIMSRRNLSHGEITYALALADALTEPVLSADLRSHAELELLTKSNGIHEQIVEVLDPEEISPTVYKFAELRRQLMSLVPPECQITGKQFADACLGSIDGLTSGFRHTIANAQSLTETQVNQIVSQWTDERRTWTKAFDEDSVEWITERLRNGRLTDLTDVSQLEENLSASPNSNCAFILAEISSTTARHSFSEQALRKASDLDPGSVGPWNDLGNLFQNHLARYTEAESAYRKAIELDPTCATPWNGLGNLLQNHLSRYEEAENAYRRAIKLDPNSPSPWHNLGNLLSRHLDRHQEAENAYRRAIKIDASFANSWNSLGTLLTEQFARHEEAEHAYRRAIQLDSNLAVAWNNLGNLLQNQFARYQEAEDAYRRAIELDSGFAAAWNNLGCLFKKHSARFQESEEAYRKSIELAPNHPGVWNNFGNLLAENLADYEEAEVAYRKAIELDPISSSNWNGLGNLLSEHLSRYQEAEDAFRKAIELDPNDANPWNGLGNLLKDHLFRYQEAEDAYCKANKLDSNYVHAWYNLGTLYRSKLARYPEAENAYRKAIEIDPNYASSWTGLGHLLKNHLSRYEEAEDAYRKAVELVPNDSNVWNNLGNLLQDYLSKFREAETVYREAIQIEPHGVMPRHNLVFLLRDAEADRIEEAKEEFGQIKDSEECLDTLRLQEALFAAYDDNWGICRESLNAALFEIGDSLPENTADDWYRSVGVLLHLGYGERLTQFLEDQGADIKLLPFHEAVSAHARGDRRYLLNIPAEARPIAEKIFDEIELRRQRLPEKTKRVRD